MRLYTFIMIFFFCGLNQYVYAIENFQTGDLIGFSNHSDLAAYFSQIITGSPVDDVGIIIKTEQETLLLHFDNQKGVALESLVNHLNKLESDTPYIVSRVTKDLSSNQIKVIREWALRFHKSRKSVEIIGSSSDLIKEMLIQLGRRDLISTARIFRNEKTLNEAQEIVDKLIPGKIKFEIDSIPAAAWFLPPYSIKGGTIRQIFAHPKDTVVQWRERKALGRIEKALKSKSSHSLVLEGIPLEKFTQFDQLDLNNLELDIKNSESHKIPDLSEYIHNNIGGIDNNKKFHIWLGDGPEALSDAQEQGYTIGDMVKKSEGFHKIFQAHRGNESSYIVLGVNGRDRLEHIESLLMLGGVERTNIKTQGNHRSWYNEYIEFFKTLGPAPDMIIYGFANTISERVSEDFSAFKRIIEFPAWLKSILSNKKNTSINKSDFSHHFGWEVILEDGRKVWLLRGIYGDLVDDMFNALGDYGVKDFYLANNSGSLNSSLKLKDFAIPDTASFGISTYPLALPNLEGAVSGGNYIHSSTENQQSLRWVKEMWSKADIVECEFGRILSNLYCIPDSKVYGGLIVSENLYQNKQAGMVSWRKTRNEASSIAHKHVLDILGLSSFKNANCSGLFK